MCVCVDCVFVCVYTVCTVYVGMHTETHILLGPTMKYIYVILYTAPDSGFKPQHNHKCLKSVRHIIVYANKRLRP